MLTGSGGSGLFLFGSLEDERTKSRLLTAAVPGVWSQGQSLGEGVPLAEMAVLFFSLGWPSLRPQGTTHWQALCHLGCFLAKHGVLFRCSAHSHLGQLMLESQQLLTATLRRGQYCQQWLRLQPENDGYHLPPSGHPMGGFRHIHDSVLTQPPGVWIISPALETRKAGLRRLSNSESCKSPAGSALDPPCSQNDVLSNTEKERHRGKDPRYEGNLTQRK